jgi:hypothetical protein
MSARPGAAPTSTRVLAAAPDLKIAAPQAGLTAAPIHLRRTGSAVVSPPVV